MSPLIPGEYEVEFNGVRSRHSDAPVLIAHSSGPGMDARGWAGFANKNTSESVTL